MVLEEYGGQASTSRELDPKWLGGVSDGDVFDDREIHETRKTSVQNALERYMRQGSCRCRMPCYCAACGGGEMGGGGKVKKVSPASLASTEIGRRQHLVRRCF